MPEAECAGLEIRLLVDMVGSLLDVVCSECMPLMRVGICRGEHSPASSRLIWDDNDEWHIKTSGRLKCLKSHPLIVCVVQPHGDGAHSDHGEHTLMSARSIGSARDKAPLGNARARLQPCLLSREQPCAFPERMAYVEVEIIKSEALSRAARTGGGARADLQGLQIGISCREDGGGWHSWGADPSAGVRGESSARDSNSGRAGKPWGHASEMAEWKVRDGCLDVGTNRSDSEHVREIMLDCTQTQRWGHAFVDGRPQPLTTFATGDEDHSQGETSIAEGDTIGVGLLPSTDTVFFCHNGRLLGLLSVPYLARLVAAVQVDFASNPYPEPQVIRFNVGDDAFATSSEVMLHAAHQSRICHRHRFARLKPIRSAFDFLSCYLSNKKFERRHLERLRRQQSSEILMSWFSYCSCTKEESARMMKKQAVEAMHRAFSAWLDWMNLQRAIGARDQYLLIRRRGADAEHAQTHLHEWQRRTECCKHAQQLRMRVCSREESVRPQKALIAWKLHFAGMIRLQAERVYAQARICLFRPVALARQMHQALEAWQSYCTYTCQWTFAQVERRRADVAKFFFEAWLEIISALKRSRRASSLAKIIWIRNTIKRAWRDLSTYALEQQIKRKTERQLADRHRLYLLQHHMSNWADAAHQYRGEIHKEEAWYCPLFRSSVLLPIIQRSHMECLLARILAWSEWTMHIRSWRQKVQVMERRAQQRSRYQMTRKIMLIFSSWSSASSMLQEARRHGIYQSAMKKRNILKTCIYHWHFRAREWKRKRALHHRASYQGNKKLLQASRARWIRSRASETFAATAQRYMHARDVVRRQKDVMSRWALITQCQAFAYSLRQQILLKRKSRTWKSWQQELQNSAKTGHMARLADTLARRRETRSKQEAFRAVRHASWRQGGCRAIAGRLIRLAQIRKTAEVWRAWHAQSILRRTLNAKMSAGMYTCNCMFACI